MKAKMKKTEKNPGKNTKNNNTNKQTTKQYNEKQTNKPKQISYKYCEYNLSSLIVYLKDLSVIISTEHSEADVELNEEVKEISSVHTETFAKPQEWHLFDFVEFMPKITTKEYANTKYKHPGLVVSCCARRRAGFFIWNVLLIMVNMVLILIIIFVLII